MLELLLLPWLALWMLAVAGEALHLPFQPVRVLWIRPGRIGCLPRYWGPGYPGWGYAVCVGVDLLWKLLADRD